MIKTNPQSSSFLIPPRSVDLLPGVFRLPSVLEWSGPDEVASAFVDSSMPRASVSEKACVKVRLESDLKGWDAYELRVHPDGVELVGKSPAAVFYALQTFHSIPRIEENLLPCLKILDHADFKRRGLYYDCSRGKVPTLETLYELIDLCGSLKLNELQLYVENVFEFNRHPKIGEGFDPFTAEDFKSLQARCKERHIQFVGSLAGLGHMETVLALPEYQSLGELSGYRGYPGGSTLCVTDPGSLKLVRELYEEFVPCFEALDFNLCGDEPWELGKGRSREAAEKQGVGSLYANFISDLHHDLKGNYGKRVNMWGDVVANHPECLEQIPSDTVMLNWDYSAEGERFAFGEKIVDHGFPLVVCPGTNAWQSHGSRLSVAFQNVSGFAKAGREQGAEGLLMTDWGDGGHRNFLGVSLLPIAFAAAHAWNGADVVQETWGEIACKEVLGYPDAPAAMNRLLKLGSLAPKNPEVLYHGLLAPVDLEKDYLDDLDPRSPVRMARTCFSEQVDLANLEEMVGVIKEINPDEFGSPEAGLTADFKTLAQCEIALAARMDVLAARRILMIRNLRKGQKPSEAAAKELQDEMITASEQFDSLWMARNRRSRLEDNLTVWRRAAEDLLNYC